MRTSETRRDDVFGANLRTIYEKTDQLFFWLLIAQWILAVAVALLVSPYGSAGKVRALYLPAQLAVVLGGLINALPLALIRLRPGWWVTRQSVAVVQMLWSGLMIHLTGGRIETHSHVFVSLAFLAFYRDWRLFPTATIVVSADHLARGFLWPESIYGIANPEWWRFLEHAAWVIFEDAVLILGCRRSVAEMEIVADREAALDAVNTNLQNAQAELARVMRVSALGELAASIAHEVSQPLAAISADATAGLNWLGFEPPNLEGVSEALAAIDSDCQRAGEVLSRINALLKRAPFQRTTCDLNAIVSGVVPLVRPQFETKGVALETELDREALPILGDSVQLQQVLINLLLNAADACRSLEADRRRVVVRTATERRDGQTWSVASVADTGKGIEPEVKVRIFDAFYTTKSDGLGMGLAISRSILLRHDGELTVSLNRPHGATFAVCLPSLP